VSTPNPALVSQQAVQRLPRIPLLLLCAAYLLPGLFFRDPWKNADITAFGYMAAMAQGRTSWLHPLVGGLPVDTAVLPHWLGAVFIWLLSPTLSAPFAARLPFAALLAGTLLLTWYSCFHWARTEGAQPLPFAFGGEAKTVDYARALADGAVLALIASLGLLQLGHETTPELAQLFATALLMWSLAAAPYRGAKAGAAALLALPLLAACGAPAMAIGAGLLLTLIDWRAAARSTAPRNFWCWTLAGTLAAALAAMALRTWAWRQGFQPSLEQVQQLLRLFAWFLWPCWLLALWTLWRWRHRLGERHFAQPLAIAAVAVVACVVMGGSDRALMLGLPSFAVLAAFALPTLKRSTSAAIDWFSVFFFSGCAVFGWVMYLAMQTGMPAKPAANIARLAPGFHAQFSLASFAFAALGTVAWLWLVRWRTGRHRPALWKSLVLPASGVALCWLLVMTLWRPVINYDRSYRNWVARLQTQVPASHCISVTGLPRAPIAALEYFGAYQVRTVPGVDQADCPSLLLPGKPAAPAGWQLVAPVTQPGERIETMTLYRRAP
jgi:hypothetical protein